MVMVGYTESRNTVRDHRIFELQKNIQSTDPRVSKGHLISSQIRIFNVDTITGVITKVHESEVDMWIVAAKCLGMTAGTSMSLVCGRNRSGRAGDWQAVPQDGCSNWK